MTTTTITMDQLAATLQSAMASVGFAGWDTSTAGALTAFGAAAVCFGAGFLQRGSQSAASFAFKMFYLCTGVGYGLVGAATMILKGMKDDGKMPGMKLGDDNATHLFMWLGASVIPLGAAAMLVVANSTGNGGNPMVTKIAYALGVAATGMAALTVFLDEPILIDFLKLTMSEAMLRLMPAILTLAAQLLCLKGKFMAGGENAQTGNNQVSAAAGIYTAVTFFFCFGVSDDCGLPEGPLREAGNCPFPADFNEYAVLNSAVILASLFMMWAGAKSARAVEEGNMAVIMDAGEAGPSGEKSSSDSD